MSYLQTLWDIFERFLYSEYERDSELDIPLQTDSDSDSNSDSDSEIIDIQNMSSDDTIDTSISSTCIKKLNSNTICDNV